MTVALAVEWIWGGTSGYMMQFYTVAAGLCHAAGSERLAWKSCFLFAGHPPCSAVEWTDVREGCSFPYSFLSLPCQEFNFMRLFTAVYSWVPLLFSPWLSPPPSHSVQVCVHSAVATSWPVYKGSNIKMDQEILVPFYTDSFPSHGSKCLKLPSRPTRRPGKTCWKVIATVLSNARSQVEVQSPSSPKVKFWNMWIQENPSARFCFAAGGWADEHESDGS